MDPSNVIRIVSRRLRVIAAVAAVAATASSPLLARAAGGVPSPEKARLASALCTFVPFGLGLGTALVSSNETAQNLGGALAESGLEVGPWVGYDYGRIGGMGTRGMIGRFVILRGTALWAVDIDESGPDRDDEAFLVAALGIVAAIAWAAHDIRRVGPLVEARNARAQGGGVRLGVAADGEGRPILVARARF
jgi:hypothetical protein